MKTSPFILREVLGEDCRLALAGAEQRDLYACAIRLASLEEVRQANWWNVTG